jgi:hypothetical protein
MNSINYDLYKSTSEEYYKLLKEGKENTRVGIGFKGEMDYWWKRLTKEERIELINSSKKELEEMFSESFQKMFPNEKI